MSRSPTSRAVRRLLTTGLSLLLALTMTMPARAQDCGLAGLLKTLDPITRGLVSGLLTLNCSAVAVPAVFGSVDLLGGPAGMAQGEIQVTCTFSLLNGLIPLPPLLVCYDIALSRTTSLGGYATRQMSNGPQHLDYNLYTNSSRTTIWGDGSGGSATVTDSYLLSLGTTTVSYPVYGRLPTGQISPPGAYLDSIVATVSW